MCSTHRERKIKLQELDLASPLFVFHNLNPLIILQFNISYCIVYNQMNSFVKMFAEQRLSYLSSQ